MRKLYNVKNQQSVSEAAKRMSISHNVVFNVIDLTTNEIVQTHESHNAATNSLLTGIAHYLIGDGVYNQAYDMLSRYIPRYISLGTMGLFTQDSDEEGLPLGLGFDTDTLSGYDKDGNKMYYGDAETERLCHYISQCPGFGADGYDENENNGRPYFGLGPIFDNRPYRDTIYCELINDSYPRTAISYREIIPESEAEIPNTIDVIYSGMISTGALAQFRGANSDTSDRTYLFITEAGLWARKTWESGGDNGLLAAYRIVPPNQRNWDLGTYVDGHEDDQGIWVPPHYELDPNDEEHALKQQANQRILKRNILRVNRNQVVQVIWKIQIGGLEQLGGMSELYPSLESALIWHLWDDDYTLLEFGTLENFPPVGIEGYIYKDMSTNICYTWNKTTKRYLQLSA